MAKKIYSGPLTNDDDWGEVKVSDPRGWPADGRSVQKFIKGSLQGLGNSIQGLDGKVDTKAGAFWFDKQNNRFLVFKDTDDRDAYEADQTQVHLILTQFAAMSDFTLRMGLETSPVVYIAKGGLGNIIRFKPIVTDTSGTIIYGSVVCNVTITQGTKVANAQILASVNETSILDLDKYLSDEAVPAYVLIEGRHEGTGERASTTVVYHIVDLAISTTYRLGTVVNTASGSSSFYFPVEVNGNNSYVEWYVDGAKYGVDDQFSLGGSLNKEINVSGLSAGVHSIQVRAYINTDAGYFYSKTLYRDVFIDDGSYQNTSIGLGFDLDEVASGGTIKLPDIIQFSEYPISVSVHSPMGLASVPVKMVISGSPSDILEENFTITNDSVYVYNYSPRTIGTKYIELSSKRGATTTTYPRQIEVEVLEGVIKLDPITNGLILDLDARNKSNSSSNRDVWTYNSYSTTFTGFNWNDNSGWYKGRLEIPEGASIEVNCNPFSSVNYNSGLTFEMEFSTKGVTDEDYTVLDMLGNAGIKVTASELIMKESQNAVPLSVRFKPEDNVRVAFVINPRNAGNARLAFIYINGILSAAAVYNGNFTNTNMIAIHGHSSCSVSLKQLRVYDRMLNSDEILHNYIIYRDIESERVQLYLRNTIKTNGVININALLEQCPVLLVTGDIAQLEAMNDKKYTIPINAEYINVQDETRNFKLVGGSMRIQGTSSTRYPRKNFRLYSNEKSGEAPSEMFDYQGNVIADKKFSFTKSDTGKEAQPVNCWCLKADYAESSGTHNTGVARWWNQLLYAAMIDGDHALRTEVQKAAQNWKYDVRTTVDGFPCHMLYRKTEADSWIYLGKYNFNNDKSTESVFGFVGVPNFDYSQANVQCWEVLDNTMDIANFVKDSGTPDWGTGWDSSFESRYPDTSSPDTSSLKRLYDWVSTVDSATFALQAEQYLDLYKVAAYYIYLLRFGAVDQVTKNAMLMTEDGTHWFYINYDNDTILGLNNDGSIMYGYEIDRQSPDVGRPGYAYAGHENRLWNLLEGWSKFIDEIVPKVDRALTGAGLTFNNAIAMFDGKQAKVWSEAVYNEDADYKYLKVYRDNNDTAHLPKLQGSRESHRRWWLSHRFNLYDSRWGASTFTNTYVNFKAETNGLKGITYSFVSGENIFYNYMVNSNLGKAKYVPSGSSGTIPIEIALVVGNPVSVLGSSSMVELDMSNFAPYFTELSFDRAVDANLGTKMTKLVLGGARNTAMNGSTLSGIGKLSALKHLDVSNYAVLDSITGLDRLSKLEELHAYGSALGNVKFAANAPVRLVELPATIEDLDLSDLPELEYSGLKSEDKFKNVSILTIRNCNRLDSYKFFYEWLDNKTMDDEYCTVHLANIKWVAGQNGSGLTAQEIFKLGELVKGSNGSTLTGIVKLVDNEVNEAVIDRFKELFGSNCLSSSSSFYIEVPPEMYITGSSEMLKGDKMLLKCDIVPEDEGTANWNLSPANVGTLTVKSADGKTCELEVLEDATVNSVIVNVSFISSTGGQHHYSTKSITLKDTQYPASIRINGTRSLNSLGTHPFHITLHDSGGNDITGTTHDSGVYSKVEWRLSGDAFDLGMVELVPSDALSREKMVNVKDTTDYKRGVLTVSLYKKLDNSVVATDSFEFEVVNQDVLMTSFSNQGFMKFCYDTYKDSHGVQEDFMTKAQAIGINTIPVVGSSYQIESMKELEEFGLSELPAKFMMNHSELRSLRLPRSLNKIGAVAFGACYNLTDGVEIPRTVTTICSGAFAVCPIEKFVHHGGWAFSAEGMGTYNSLLNTAYFKPGFNTLDFSNVDLSALNSIPNVSYRLTTHTPLTGYGQIGYGESWHEDGYGLREIIFKDNYTSNPSRWTPVEHQGFLERAILNMNAETLGNIFWNYTYTGGIEGVDLHINAPNATKLSGAIQLGNVESLHFNCPKLKEVAITQYFYTGLLKTLKFPDSVETLHLNSGTNIAYLEIFEANGVKEMIPLSNAPQLHTVNILSCETIPDNCFWNSCDISLTVNARNIRSIGNFAFNTRNNIPIRIPYSCIDIKDQVFRFDAADNISIEDGNLHYHLEDGILYYDDGSEKYVVQVFNGNRAIKVGYTTMQGRAIYGFEGEVDLSQVDTIKKVYPSTTANIDLIGRDAKISKIDLSGFLGKEARRHIYNITSQGNEYLEELVLGGNAPYQSSSGYFPNIGGLYNLHTIRCKGKPSLIASIGSYAGINGNSYAGVNVDNAITQKVIYVPTAEVSAYQTTNYWNWLFESNRYPATGVWAIQGE